MKAIFCKIIAMQSVRHQSVRRLFIFFLTFVVIGLAGCGGGGGSPASVPLSSNASGSVLDQGQAATLFSQLSGQGQSWLAMVEGDSGIFRLNGQSQNTNSILSKLPNADPARSITRTYSQLQYYPAPSNSIDDPGRYMLLGRLTSGDVLSTATQRVFNYGMSGHWSCSNCGGAVQLRQGTLAGSLAVDLDQSRGVVDLAGDGLTLNNNLDLSKTSELSATSLPQISLDGTALTPIRSEFLGGLFGPNAQDAGVLFGIADNQGRVFSGQAIGGQ